MTGFLASLLLCSVTMSLVSLLFLLFDPFIARCGARWRYLAWLIIIIGFAVPIKPSIPGIPAISLEQFGRWRQEPQAEVTSTAESVTLLENVTSMEDAALPEDVTIPGLFLPSADKSNTALPPHSAYVADSGLKASFWSDLAVWLAGSVWFAGFALTVCRQTARHIRFLKAVKRWGESITDEDTLAALGSVKEELRVGKQVELKRCPLTESPMMIGFIRPVILLPATSFNADETRFILKHELLHFKRRDIWAKCLAMLATALHWFNPMIYLAAKAFDSQCESACDDGVIGGMDAVTRRKYGEAIIGVVRRQSMARTALSTNFYGGIKGMKRRVISIMDMRKKRAGAFVLIAALALTFASSAAFAEAPDKREYADPGVPVTFIESNQETPAAGTGSVPPTETSSYSAPNSIISTSYEGASTDAVPEHGYIDAVSSPDYGYTDGIAVSNFVLSEISKERFLIYEKFGMTYDPDEVFRYKGKTVRSFIDEKSTVAFVLDVENDYEKSVDLIAVRGENDALIDLYEESKEAFDARTAKIGQWRNMSQGTWSQGAWSQDTINSGNSKTTSESAVAADNTTYSLNPSTGAASDGIASGSALYSAEDSQEDTILEDYTGFGIYYDNISGQWNYEGKHIRYLYDTGHFTYYNGSTEAEENGIILFVFRDEEGQIKGVREITSKEFLDHFLYLSESLGLTVDIKDPEAQRE